MSITILEVLQNAYINLGEGAAQFQNEVGRSQLRNAITLLSDGKTVDEDFDEDDLE